MKPCPSCHRHVEHDERSCPFCGEAIGSTTTHRARFAFGLAAALTGCGPLVDVGNADGDGGSTAAPDGTSTSTSTSTTTTTTTTTFPTTSSTTADPTTTGTAGSSSTEVDSSNFIQDPDGGSLYGLECSLWDQDCPDGDKCMPWANDGGNQWNANRCSPIAATPGQAGDPCTMEGGTFVSGVDDCEIGHMCFHVDPETLEGVCVAMCQGSENNPVCTDASLTCSISHEGTMILCLQPCDPLAQDCAEGLSCQAAPAEFVCVRPGVGAVGDPCGLFVDCEAGLSCVAMSTPKCDGTCCTEACDPVTPTCPLPEQTCVPFDDAGICAVE